MFREHTLSNTSRRALALFSSMAMKEAYSLYRSYSSNAIFRAVERSSGLWSVQSPSSLAVRAVRGVINDCLGPVSIAFVREGGCDMVLPQTTGGWGGQQDTTPLPACMSYMSEIVPRGDKHPNIICGDVIIERYDD